MGLLSNRIGRESLKPGDHVYSWRTAYIYAHHGIFVGENKVIHFTRARGEEVGTGTVIDVLLTSSGPPVRGGCSSCSHQREELGGGVVSSCLDCFLAGGVLYRFEYGVSPALFLAKARGGTCTLAAADPPPSSPTGRPTCSPTAASGATASSRATARTSPSTARPACSWWSRNGGQSGQAISLIGGPAAAAFSTPIRLLSTNIYGMAATAVGVYCASRYFADIGNRRDVVKVAVEDLTSQLATARVQLVDMNGAPFSPSPSRGESAAAAGDRKRSSTRG
ncbi:unnamed protein product [Spirodela intermedia]|uniref:LRAT domain-containing protein n=1 Tax=Spirodela intermedia TaxID=51605 RepID=A0A7I8IRC6_SPIIN|nr:unnamed protein product [Spirodela intermedia]CAA6660501.1 unnamed protein product [Spirodela intermedia]